MIIRELSYSFSDFGFPISFDDEDSDEVDMDVNVSPSEPGKFPLSDEQMLQRLLVLGGITAVRTGQYPKNHAPTDLTLINRMINSGQGPVVRCGCHHNHVIIVINSTVMDYAGIVCLYLWPSVLL